MTWLSMGAFRVDTDALDACIAGLGQTETELETIGADLARRLAALHENWRGDAARAQMAAQRRWETSLRELQDALTDLRRAAQHAHRSYNAAIDANRRMWAQVV